MLETYAREFAAIGKFLESNGELHKGYIIIERCQLEEMLNKNRFDTALNKLHIWKNLKWIDADKDGEHLTKRVRCSDQEGTKRYKRVIKIDRAVLSQVEKLVDSGYKKAGNGGRS